MYYIYSVQCFASSFDGPFTASEALAFHKEWLSKAEPNETGYAFQVIKGELVEVQPVEVVTQFKLSK